MQEQKLATITARSTSAVTVAQKHMMDLDQAAPRASQPHRLSPDRSETTCLPALGSYIKLLLQDVSFRLLPKWFRTPGACGCRCPTIRLRRNGNRNDKWQKRVILLATDEVQVHVRTGATIYVKTLRFLPPDRPESHRTFSALRNCKVSRVKKVLASSHQLRSGLDIAQFPAWTGEISCHIHLVPIITLVWRVVLRCRRPIWTKKRTRPNDHMLEMERILWP
ncbi:hypothetical protein J6590_031666 [Homalodisca vitripennis]|nr:hypothetical protein J6590_031666 [Homalodisca vitripennis]